MLLGGVEEFLLGSWKSSPHPISFSEEELWIWKGESKLKVRKKKKPSEGGVGQSGMVVSAHWDERHPKVDRVWV